MNIANIFGLHLGCMVHCDDTICDNVGKLIEVKERWIKVKYTEFNSGRNFQIKDCKLLLKPLSAISEENKAEFVDTFLGDGFKRFCILDDMDESGIFYRESGSETRYSRRYFITEALFLSTHGYDLDGIVPDEYKEVTNEH